MPEWVKYVSLMVNFVLVIMCLSHIAILIYEEVHPNLPLREHFEKNLDEIEFPLSFKFCIFETKNKKNDRNRFSQFGYTDNAGFFMGRSKYNKSIIGWGGHTENGATLGSVKGAKNNTQRSTRSKEIYFTN